MSVFCDREITMLHQIVTGIVDHSLQNIYETQKSSGLPQIYLGIVSDIEALSQTANCRILTY